jgi:hypothetical protein
VQKVNIDIQAAIDYRSELLSFTSNLTELIIEMESSLKNLSDDWQDDKYEEFCQEFSRCMQYAKVIEEDCKAILPKVDDAIEKAQIVQNAMGNLGGGR